MKTRGRPDFLLLTLTFILVGFGLVMVYSASSVYALYETFTHHDSTYFMKRQILWACLGLIGMFVTMNVPYTFYKKKFGSIMAITFFVLFAVLIPGIGSVHKGARSWFDFGPVSLQPAEFAKIAIVLYLAGIIAKKGEKFREFKKGFIPPMAVSLAFAVVIAVQPDFGSAAILMLTAVSVLFAGGVNLKHLFGLLIPIGGAGFLYVFTSPYRWSRIANFTNPWNDGFNGLGAGYQLVHSFFALAHGGLTGAGLGKSIEKYLYLPEVQTDFIFSILSEELGFIGAFIFIIVYLFFLWRILTITLRVKDVFCNLVGIGVVSMTFIQAFINIGGVLGAIPITGVPLPFISYGGSSLLLNLISMGIVLSISRETHKEKNTKLQNAERKTQSSIQLVNGK
ncbi:putative lipid II flippase FtsW [Aneurinibacillus sp. Ricciae_BoGa-3]|uniref:putative lipid II flippase FtsW n=1 Tax=Aneurinibacillus sp. Ricciae_BoGa-3 TaxID=3022697 RepID=UPI0023421ADD|nr:putative lipid II flippase FtsW [Aneurinibacillus sp. Ricciae_BoGa-3]WCK54694.1 putative lipid II flippase FtsW [Aneurinibacillus sp. Ricciae_BoGa-3]